MGTDSWVWMPMTQVCLPIQRIATITDNNSFFERTRVTMYLTQMGHEAGFRMITTSPFSTNFNHITYYTIA